MLSEVIDVDEHMVSVAMADKRGGVVFFEPVGGLFPSLDTGDSAALGSTSRWGQRGWNFPGY